MKKSVFLLTAALFACAANGDDRLRDVQAELKNQGFYYGEIDGKSGDETNAAVRRFQIRNGLKVTGTVDDETVAALGIGGTKPTPPVEAPAKPSEPDWQPPAPKKTPQVNPQPPKPEAMDDEPARPTIKNKQRDLLVRERERDNTPAEDSEPPREKILRGVPVDPSVVEPPRAIPNATFNLSDVVFRGTPYATAPRELQEDTLAAAQRILQRERLYRGQVDGAAGPMTSEAIFAFQERYALRPTGRLDLDTLARMNLLPRVAPPPASSPFYNPNHRRDRTVLRGVWVR